MREVDATPGHREAWVRLIDDKYGPSKREIDFDVLRGLLENYDVRHPSNHT
jgi:hypothetical protein